MRGRQHAGRRRGQSLPTPAPCLGRLTPARPLPPTLPPQALSHAPRLKNLALNSCPKISDRGLQALGRCATLRELAVDRCPQLWPGAVQILQRRLPMLRLARPAGGRAGTTWLAALEY